MKANFFLVLFSVCSFFASAQQQCVAAPDSLGKAIAAAFLNREDLRKLPVFPTGEDVGLINEFLATVADTTVTVATSADVSSAEGDFLFAQWQNLLKTAENNNMTVANTTFYKSYFSVSDSLNALTGINFTLYLSFKRPIDIVAIKLGVVWHQNKWVLIKIDEEFYQYHDQIKNPISFVKMGPENGWATAGKDFKIRYANSISDLHWKEKGTCLDLPNAFMNNVITDLASNKPISDYHHVISFEDFQKHFLPDYAKLLSQNLTEKSITTEDISLIKAELLMIRDYPQQAYEKYLIKDMRKLSSYFKIAGFSQASVKNTNYRIKNYENEITDNGKIIMQTDIEFSIKNASEGIRFESIFLNGKWQISSMQSSAYGIDRVETN